LGFNELDVQFSRSKLGHERIASVHAALERSEAAGLYYGSERKILKQAVLEFLVHGLRYVFYAQPGPLSRGLPTAHSALAIEKQAGCLTIWGLRLAWPWLVPWEGKQSRLCTVQSPKLSVTIQNFMPCSAWLTLFELVGCGSSV
jgi:hypothetical protein